MRFDHPGDPLLRASFMICHCWSFSARWSAPGGRISTVCLFDSGASYSVIRRATAEQIARLEPLQEPFIFETASEGNFITAEYEVFLEFFLKDAPRCFTDSFMVPDTLSEELIIGATTTQKWQIKLDFANEKVLWLCWKIAAPIGPTPIMGRSWPCPAAGTQR
jgi:hypothetical protein